jgi:hypothetical protein
MTGRMQPKIDKTTGRTPPEISTMIARIGTMIAVAVSLQPSS